jgi:hypothetical protein
MGVKTFDKSEEIRKFGLLVKPHIQSATPSDLESISIYGMLAQERRSIEIISDDIQMLENLIIVILIAPFILRHLLDRPAELLIISAAIITALLLLLEIADRKLFLGGYLLAAYLDYFVVNEGAEVADREGEPII